MRKIVQIAARSGSETEASETWAALVARDDGTTLAVWAIYACQPPPGKWERLPDIPQDPPTEDAYFKATLMKDEEPKGKVRP